MCAWDETRFPVLYFKRVKILKIYIFIRLKKINLNVIISQLFINIYFGDKYYKLLIFNNFLNITFVQVDEEAYMGGASDQNKFVWLTCVQTYALATCYTVNAICTCGLMLDWRGSTKDFVADYKIARGNGTLPNWRFWCCDLARSAKLGEKQKNMYLFILCCSFAFQNTGAVVKSVLLYGSVTFGHTCPYAFHLDSVHRESRVRCPVWELPCVHTTLHCYDVVLCGNYVRIDR